MAAGIQESHRRSLGSWARRTLAAAVAAGICAAVTSGSALAAVTCSVSGTTMAVTSDGPDRITIARSGDAIQVNDLGCGDATVTTVGTIVVTEAAGVNAPQKLTIKLAGGPFAPGAGASSGTPEIRFTVDLGGGRDQVIILGTNDPDTLTWGSLGVDLNGDGDVDVAIAHQDSLGNRKIQSLGGNDVLSGQGGLGTGDPVASSLRLDGGAGDDTVTGGGGGDELRGGPGDDAIVGGGGTDTVSYADAAVGVAVDLAAGTGAGDGTDSIQAVQNVVGSEFADTIVGDSGPNLLRGLGGNDTLSGGGGADDLRGDEGDDTLAGQDGNDQLKGDVGRDRLVGGAGDDFLAGEDGADNLSGGAGDDQLRGDAGDDLLDGGAGNDRLSGDGGSDTIAGGPGDDTLEGGFGTDRLTGGPGGDRLLARDRLRDLVDGGPGKDRAIVDKIDRVVRVERV